MHTPNCVLLVNGCKRKKCFLYHVTGFSRPMFTQNKQISEPNNEPVASNPCDKVNKPNPQTLPKPLPHQVPTSKAKASKTKPPVKPPVYPNIDLATIIFFKETNRPSVPDGECCGPTKVLLSSGHASSLDLPAGSQYPTLDFSSCNVLLQADVTPICHTLPVLNPELDPHMYNFLFLNISRLLLKSGTDKTKIDFMKDLSNSCTLFLCLCETFLNSSILNAEIFMPGFVVCRCDRVDRPGGGLCIYSGVARVSGARGQT